MVSVATCGPIHQANQRWEDFTHATDEVVIVLVGEKELRQKENCIVRSRPQQPLALWTIEFLDRFIPAATVLELNIEVIGVEPKRRYRG